MPEEMPKCRDCSGQIEHHLYLAQRRLRDCATAVRCHVVVTVVMSTYKEIETADPAARRPLHVFPTLAALLFGPKRIEKRRDVSHDRVAHGPIPWSSGTSDQSAALPDACAFAGSVQPIAKMCVAPATS